MREHVVLGNRRVRLVFEPESLGLSAMVDLEAGLDHMQKTDGRRSLWQLVLACGPERTTLSNVDLPCSLAEIRSSDNGAQSAVLEWKDLDLRDEKRALSVAVTVELPHESGIASWRISVDNRSTRWGLWEIEFPKLNGYLRAGQYDVAIPPGHDETWGALFKGCAEKISRDYPVGWSMSMQFLCACKEEHGVYMAAHDPRAWVKSFTLSPGKEFSVKTFPEDMGVPGSGHEAPFPVMLGVYRGDWMTACKIYREFAVTAPWAAKGRLSDRSSTPQALKDIGLWFRVGSALGVGEESPEDRNRPLVEAQEFFDVPLGVHWYDWHVTPFDTGYPHFLPAKPGVPAQMKDLVAKGVVTMPYINGRIVDKSIDEFAAFVPGCIKDQEGTIGEETYGNDVLQAPMCPHTGFWQETITETVRRMQDELGVNAVYVDQISAAEPLLCFDPGHGHPLGGGGWWVDGYRRMLNRIREVAHGGNKELIITSECTAEPNMDGIDAFLSWTRRNEKTIPMMPAVYSGYTIYFGSPESLELSDDEWRMAQGQEFLWGCQNGWMELDLLKPEHREKADFLRKIGKYRMVGKKFLTYGELVDLIGDKRGFGFRGIPRVQGSVWKAEDGALGIFLANLQGVADAVEVALDVRTYGLSTLANCRVTRIGPQGARVLPDAPGPKMTLREELGPWAIDFLEIKPVAR